MKIAGHDIGVCSWSLKPRDTADLIGRIKKLGLAHVQLALGGIVTMDDKRKHQELGLLRNSGLIFTAGMIGFPGEDYTTIASIKKTGGCLTVGGVFLPPPAPLSAARRPRADVG